MAFIYQRKRSPFWWINYIDSKTGKRNRKSTKLKIGNIAQARKLEAEYTFHESQLISATPSENWNNWVEKFWDNRYGEQKLRAQCAWRVLKLFLDEHKFTAPRQIIREHASWYLAWRKKPNKSIGKYKAGRNTTILEIKFMSILIDEAVLRGYAVFNPWLKLKLHREPGRPKPEYPRTALATILAAIRKETGPHREFFLHSFLIARYHGCRLSETCINPLTDIQEIDGQLVIIFKTKGGRDHSVNLHPKLARRIRHRRAARRTDMYKRPKSPAKEWFSFLTRIGIKNRYPGACFHSLRVTAATTLARKGISEKRAMEYIGHASTTIHRSYVRLKPADLTVCAEALD